eukprot:12183329-Prorocentrum_lima.AAC.1
MAQDDSRCRNYMQGGEGAGGREGKGGERGGEIPGWKESRPARTIKPEGKMGGEGAGGEGGKR